MHHRSNDHADHINGQMVPRVQRGFNAVRLQQQQPQQQQQQQQQQHADAAKTITDVFSKEAVRARSKEARTFFSDLQIEAFDATVRAFGLAQQSVCEPTRLPCPLLPADEKASEFLFSPEELGPSP